MQSSAYPEFRVSVIAVVLFQVTALFARSMLDIQLRRRGIDAAVAKDLSYLVVPPILLVLMFPYLRRWRESLGRLFSLRLLTLRLVAVSVALGLTLRLTYWACLTFLIGIGVIRSDDPNAIVGPLVGFDCPPLRILALGVLVMAVMVPIIEETVHRGFILGGLLSYGTRFAIAGSAVLFALMHESGTYAMAFLAGLVLAMQALNHRVLWGPAIAHATYNCLSVIDWRCLSLIWNPQTTDPLLTALKWVSLPIVIGGIFLILRLISPEAAGVRTKAPQPG